LKKSVLFSNHFTILYIPCQKKWPEADKEHFEVL